MNENKNTMPSFRKRRLQNSTSKEKPANKKNTKVNHSVPSFNSLPIEILKEIFCNVECEYLLELKRVCRSWNRKINELLDIKHLKISDSRKANAAAIFQQKEKYHQRCSLKLYRAPYAINHIMDDVLLAKLLKETVHHCAHSSYDDIAVILKELATEFADTPKDTAWKATLSLTGLEDLDKELQDFDSEFVKSRMSAFRWYKFTSAYDKEDIGIVTVYPDMRTFSIYIYPDTEEDFSSESSYDNYRYMYSYNEYGGWGFSDEYDSSDEYGYSD